MRRFHVCLHDATPAFASETRAMLRDLAPLLDRRLSAGVVPNWHGQWPLAAHAGYGGLIRDAAEELLLHGYFHRRQRGAGPITVLTDRSDEMNGLDPEETRRTIERGQRDFAAAFGASARGFIAPGWQSGHVRPGNGVLLELDYVLGFFWLASRAGRRVPLATWSWDCGRWGRLGHVGHGIGWLLQSQHHRVPVIAVHPRDLARGFWPAILRVIDDLLEREYEPSTLAELLEVNDGCVTL